MSEPQFDFGPALSIDAEAVGQPGQRRFRILVRSSRQSASIWMEKEQLAALGRALAEFIQRLDKERPKNDPDVEPLDFPSSFDIEMQVGQIGLGYVEDDDMFSIQTQGLLLAADNAEGAFRCLLSRGQSRFLSRKIEQVAAAGRPNCPLCGGPLDPGGHTCPRANGHRNTKITI